MANEKIASFAGAELSRGWFLLQAAPAVAANINIVWTSEVGQFAPLWVTSEVISGAAPGVFQGLRAWSRWEC
jgi:hypothetical protein